MQLLDTMLDSLIKKLCGQDTIPLVHELINKKKVNEFKLADDLDININQIRNMLYRLHAHNLVYFLRKKDKKKGWYVYYWMFNLNHAYSLLQKITNESIESLKKRREKEKKNISFICSNGCVKFTIETALEHQFKCPECGTLVVQESNIQVIEELNSQIEKMEKESVKLSEEITNFLIIEEKKREKLTKKLKEKKVKVKKATKKEIKKKEGVKPTKQRRLRLKKILKLRAKMKGLRTKKKANKKK